MHEMGIVSRIVNIAEEHAKKNNAQNVAKLVLQIGQLSAVIPDAVRMCYPIASQGTMLEKAELVIEVIPAMGVCGQCGNEYNVVENEFKCPKCQGEKWDLRSGRDLLIKEIAVY